MHVRKAIIVISSRPQRGRLTRLIRLFLVWIGLVKSRLILEYVCGSFAFLPK